MNNIHHSIDVPFHFRHSCWFCGEPSGENLRFPKVNSVDLACPHPSIELPSCKECKTFAHKAVAQTIWQCRQQVKKSLMKRYSKDLAIGKNWTQEELANSDFEGGNFEGFARSAWFVFEVARDRVNYNGWPLWCHGEQIENDFAGGEFSFDGVTYSDISEALEFYVNTYHLNREFFLQVLKVVGVKRFGYAIRFARLYVGYTPEARREILKDFSATEKSC